MTTDAQAIAAVLDRQAIVANLACHAFGLDRRDVALIQCAYTEDATVAYGLFEGKAFDFAEMIGGFMATMPPTQHRTSNMLIRVDGDTAVSESCVVTCMTLPDGEVPQTSLVQGRYLDRHRRAGSGWRIEHRTYVFDWHLNARLDGPVPDVLPAAVTESVAAQPPSFAHEETNMSLSDDLRAGLEGALARNAIHDLIMLQARAIDRGDEGLLSGLWHEGATVDLGFFTGSAEEFCPFIISATAGMKRMTHTVANEHIEVRGNDALAESYVVAFTTLEETAGEAVDEITAGRYLDRFALRDGTWKFTERRFIKDFSMRQPAQPESPEDMTAQLTLRGKRSADDPVYAFWSE